MPLMEGIKFVDVLRSFESKVEGEEYGETEKDYDERKVIENDVRRTTFVGVDKGNARKVRMLRKILFDSLDRIPNKYTQGMSEIASVFVLYYLEDVVDKMPGENNNESLNDIGLQEQFIDADQTGEAGLAELESKHRDRLDTLRTVLVNVFARKFEPLVANDFQMYKANIRVFVEMMRKRGIRISELESHRFMGCIFTFFLRSLATKEDVYKVFEIILSCPNTCLFLLLAAFYSKISRNEGIRDVGEDLFPKVIKLEKEFVETEKRMEGDGTGFSMKTALLLGGAASVVAAFFIYRITKKE